MSIVDKQWSIYFSNELQLNHQVNWQIAHLKCWEANLIFTMRQNLLSFRSSKFLGHFRKICTYKSISCISLFTFTFHASINIDTFCIRTAKRWIDNTFVDICEEKWNGLITGLCD